jgi:hypothetical protein
MPRRLAQVINRDPRHAALHAGAITERGALAGPHTSSRCRLVPRIGYGAASNRLRMPQTRGGPKPPCPCP